MPDGCCQAASLTASRQGATLAQAVQNAVLAGHRGDAVMFVCATRGLALAQEAGPTMQQLDALELDALHAPLLGQELPNIRVDWADDLDHMHMVMDVVRTPSSHRDDQESFSSTRVAALLRPSSFTIASSQAVTCHASRERSSVCRVFCCGASHVCTSCCCRRLRAAMAAAREHPACPHAANVGTRGTAARSARSRTEQATKQCARQYRRRPAWSGH
jgi:hypothetical protein